MRARLGYPWDLNADHVEPRGLGGAMAEARLSARDQDATEAVTDAPAEAFRFFPQPRVDGVLKNSAKAPHHCHGPKREIALTIPWFGKVSETAPRPAGGMKNARSTTRPRKRVTLSVEAVSAQLGIDRAWASEKDGMRTH